jgi:uncharacterized protein YkwD
MLWARSVMAGFGVVVVLSLMVGAGLAAGAVINLPSGIATSYSSVAPSEELELFRLLNRARSDAREPLLAMDPRLRSMARAFSEDMASHGFIGHESSSGETLRERLSAALRPGTEFGENVGLVQTVEQANRAFLASPAHRTVMLYPAFRHVGIGITTAGRQELVITEDFTQ